MDSETMLKNVLDHNTDEQREIHNVALHDSYSQLSTYIFFHHNNWLFRTKIVISAAPRCYYVACPYGIMGIQSYCILCTFYIVAIIFKIMTISYR
jgi:hypothetical protein